MPEATPIMQSEKEVSDIVQRKVRRTVGVRALRQILQIVDQWREEEQQDEKLRRVAIIILVAILAGLFLFGRYFFMQHAGIYWQR